MKLMVSIFICSLAYLFANHLPDQWEKIYDSPELTVYRKEVTGFDTFAFRAIGKIHSPLSKVASVLVDADRRKEWMPDVGDTWVLEHINPDVRVEYVHIKTPFIIKDREFVLRAKADWNKESRTMTFSFDSVENDKAPKTKRIRAALFESKYVLKELTPDTTEVEFTVHVDPKGTVPKWIVNLFQKSYPKKTLEALSKQSQRDDVFEEEEVSRTVGKLTLPTQE